MSTGRETLRRGGFAELDQAEQQIADVKALLRIPDPDDTESLRLVIDLVTQGTARGGALPSPEEVRRRLLSGQSLTERLTVGEWLDQWLRGKKKTRTADTVRSYESHVRLYLRPHLGHLRLDRLAVSHLYDLFDAIDELNDQIEEANAARRELKAELERTTALAQRRKIREQLADMPPFRRTVGPATKQRIRATLRSALTTACRQQKITYNPAKDVELPPGKAPRSLVWTPRRVEDWQRTGQRPSPIMVWTPDLTGEFLDHAEKDRLYALFHVAAFRGLRRGESCGLHWADVDLEEKTLTIQWQIVQLGWETEMTRPKSDSSNRVVALDDETVAVLRRHRAWQARERLAAGPVWTDSGLVFTRRDGSPLHPAEVTERFRVLIAEAGLPPIRFHDLRHGAATLALAGGADMKVVQEMLGHSSVAFTSDIYTSVLPQIAFKAAEAAARLVPRATS
ncbi:hypothetical protein BL253_28120 [Pseudofrankia asymbiotica]|uniref:Site-specific integrase n=1 Tax=Pseudofrankia asymbiotica TaxID=1834516 RepID=A0A1V2I492_9ACTN|nr:hypothetical protein BL253_28120 [Pseudofrankia asymbiotica]